MIKILTRTSLLLVFTTIISLSSTAQIKLGHINSNQLLSLMPETKGADSSLQKFGTSLEAQLKTMTGEYEMKVQELQDKKESMAEPIYKAKVKELADLEDRIREFQSSAQESIQKKKEELYSPILKKADEAIKAVSKEKGYTYIFDASAGFLLYAQDSDDILNLVKGKLGLK